MPLVAERLDDPSSEVRRFGAGTLMTMAIAESGKRAMSHPSVLPKLAALMTDPDPFVEVRYFTYPVLLFIYTFTFNIQCSEIFTLTPSSRGEAYASSICMIHNQYVICSDSHLHCITHDMFHHL